MTELLPTEALSSYLDDAEEVTPEGIVKWLEDSGFAIVAAQQDRARAPNINAAAQWLAEEVLRVTWHGLLDGSAKDRGFDPWVHFNARKDDVRDAVRGVLRAVEQGQDKP